MPDYDAIIEQSIAWALDATARCDAQVLEDERNRAAEQHAAHATRMAQLEFERERALTMAAFCQVARRDFEQWLRERGIITGR